VQADGTFIAGDARALSLPAWAMVHGLAMLLVDAQVTALVDKPLTAETLANMVADVLMRGLASDRPTRAKPRRRS
jgi:hypothetical protein